MKASEVLASEVLLGGQSYQRFAVPEDILVDRDLPGDERRRLLDAWKFELELRTDRMSRADQVERAAPDELLRRVNACRRLLSEETED